MIRRRGNTRSDSFLRQAVWRFAFAILITFCSLGVAKADGTLTFTISDEATEQPVISRIELWRPDKQGRGKALGPNNPKTRLRIDRTKQMPVRRTVPAGIGFVLDREMPFELPDGPYHFRLIRGPEYRIISGNFTLERDSLDSHRVALPRMINMHESGWTSGDCCVLPSKNSLPLSMASEDLHVAASIGSVPANPIPYRSEDDPIQFDPLWIRNDVRLDRGLAYYGQVQDFDDQKPTASNLNTVQDETVKVAIENPFAWQAPVWLASERVDGMFLLGDWLRLDKTIRTPDGGPKVKLKLGNDPLMMGRHAETIYRHCLECGIRMAPMAGSGSDDAKSPIGYNRVYATNAKQNGYQDDAFEDPVAPSSADDWWQAVWNGRTVVSNGPCLQAYLGGKLPGHTFTSNGEALRVQPEIQLAVRDPVEYLNVIHNDQIRYSARLDDFAKAGGKIPPLTIDESGWVMIRVVTQYEGHYRVAFSAPWYFEFRGQPRINKTSVEYFQSWLRDYEDELKKLPKSELAPHIPLIQNARGFWHERFEAATVE